MRAIRFIVRGGRRSATAAGLHTAPIPREDYLWVLATGPGVRTGTAGRLGGTAGGQDVLGDRYWDWGGEAFVFHPGYWGSRVGFYGGV